MARKEGATPGAFRKGHDVRRHIFTREECQRGGRAAWWVTMETRPEVFAWLKRKAKRTCLARSKAAYRGRNHQRASY